MTFRKWKQQFFAALKDKELLPTLTSHSRFSNENLRAMRSIGMSSQEAAHIELSELNNLAVNFPYIAGTLKGLRRGQ